MIIACEKCGGLRATEQFETYAGMPCKCGAALMAEVRSLIDYAKTENPDPYEVIRRSAAVAQKFGFQVTTSVV